MTMRGVCLLIPAVLGTVAGLLWSNSALALLSLSVALWMLTEWLWFQWRLLSEARSLTVHRTVNNRSSATGVCFMGRRLKVSVTIQRSNGRLQPWTRIRDLVPDNLTVTTGSPINLVVSSRNEFTFEYDCIPQAAGIAILAGCRIRIQDPNGFFISDQFIDAPQTLRILPAYDSTTDPCSRIKRLNGLPQHGIHRLQRAGMGSEMLELREYVPGDPPKSIAWKASARRDRLMTREYESEVPVRTIVFAESSARTRLGPCGSRPCDDSSQLVASIAKTALTAGDPAGLILFSESEIKRLTPGWGERTLFRIMERLAVSCRTDDGIASWSVDLQNLAMEICQERYPELLDARINIIPWTVFPITPWNRRIFNTRSKLANVICQLHNLSTTDSARLLYDDDFTARHLCGLLNSAGRPTGKRQASASDDEQFTLQNRTLQQLARALRQSIARARDNEHYVILCDLLSADSLLATIRPAIQLARARHHRVGFVCPLPASHAISGNGNDPPTSDLLLHEAWQIELQERRDRLTRDLRSLGAVVTFSDTDRPIAATLADLNLTRRARTAAGVN